MTDLQKTVSDNVEEHGWHAQFVSGDEIWPAFTYSIGWGITRDWPEVIIVGQRLDVAHGMLAKIWETKDKPASDQMRTDVLPEFRCKMLKVDFSWYEFLFGTAIDYYMDRNLRAFEAYQCVWPTTSDVLPWEKNAPDGFSTAQPLVNSKKNPVADIRSLCSICRSGLLADFSYAMHQLPFRGLCHHSLRPCQCLVHRKRSGWLSIPERWSTLQGTLTYTTLS